MPKHSIPIEGSGPIRQIMAEKPKVELEQLRKLEVKAAIIDDLNDIRKKTIAEDTEFNEKLQKEIEYFQELRKKERERRDSTKLEIMASVVHTLHDGLINEVEEEDLKTSKWIADEVKKLDVKKKVNFKSEKVKKSIDPAKRPSIDPKKLNTTHTPKLKKEGTSGPKKLKKEAKPKKEGTSGPKKLKMNTLPRVALLSKPKTPAVKTAVKTVVKK